MFYGRLEQLTRSPAAALNRAVAVAAAGSPEEALAITEFLSLDAYLYR
jgi:predicted RNA polymerase sigma factor